MIVFQRQLWAVDISVRGAEMCPTSVGLFDAEGDAGHVSMDLFTALCASLATAHPARGTG